MQIKHFVSSVAVLGFSLAGSVFAAPVTFGPAVHETADSDVSTTGTLVEAYNVGGASVTVNGVPFTSLTGATNTYSAGNTTLTTSAGNINSNGSAFGPPSGISASYGELLRSGGYTDAAPSPAYTFTFSNLTPNQQYEFQFFVNDSRPTGQGGGFRTGTLTGPAGSNSVALAYNVGDVAGGAGQYAIGAFTADSSTSQTITFTGTSAQGDTQVDAFQLRAVPEPASLGLVGVAGLGLLARRRCRA